MIKWHESEIIIHTVWENKLNYARILNIQNFLQNKSFVVFQSIYLQCLFYHDKPNK